MTDHLLTLTDEELRDLTRKHRPSAQCRVLRAIGIEHRQRPDGSVVVDRSHYDRLLGVVANAKVPPARRAEINWED